jgi:hypothetical protein
MIGWEGSGRWGGTAGREGGLEIIVEGQRGGTESWFSEKEGAGIKECIVVGRQKKTRSQLN